MSEDKWEGKWERMKGSVREQWGKLTDDDVQEVKGKRERLSGKLQEKYGKSKEEADKEISAFESKF